MSTNPYSDELLVKDDPREEVGEGDVCGEERHHLRRQKRAQRKHHAVVARQPQAGQKHQANEETGCVRKKK